MLVRDAMNRKVIAIKPTATAREAAQIMTKYRIGSLLVMEDEKLLGIVTELDILWKIVAKNRDPETTLVNEIMTKEVITIKPDQTLEEAAQIMVEKRIKKLPVVENDKVVGIITATDLISIQPKLIEALAKLLLFTEKKPIAG